MVKVQFHKAAKMALDGINVTLFKPGDVVSMPEAMAAIAVGEPPKGLAAAKVVGYGEAKAIVAAPENKMVAPAVVKEEKPKTETPKRTAPAAARGRGRGGRGK